MRTIWKYSEHLPSVAEGSRVSLGEGQTPLVKSRSIGPEMGLDNLYFKLENLNPTGSYKDRFAAVFVSLLNSKKQNLCIATSSGNTGAALSAYCAAANIPCFLAVVDGAPASKIKQMQLYGANIGMVKGFGKAPDVTRNVFDALKKLTAERNIPLPVSAYCYCPQGMQGVETIAYEIQDQLQGSTDHVFVPAGGGGLTLAVAKGMVNYRTVSNAQLPRVHCVQPFGNDTIAGALRAGKDKAQEVLASTTKVSGLQVPNVLDGDEVIKYCQMLNGNGYLVDDAEVLNCQRMLAQKEGIFCEPAAAVSLAGLMDAIRKNEIKRTDKIVCLITGTGFKDMTALELTFQIPDCLQLDDAPEMIKMLNDL